MKVSAAQAHRSARSTVNPPTPESKHADRDIRHTSIKSGAEWRENNKTFANRGESVIQHDQRSTPNPSRPQAGMPYSSSRTRPSSASEYIASCRLASLRSGLFLEARGLILGVVQLRESVGRSSLTPTKNSHRSVIERSESLRRGQGRHFGAG